jgi:hypothetical protein
MKKNSGKISVLAWLALLFFVFSCENEVEKERVRVERAIEVAREDSVHWYNELLSAVRNDTSLLTEDGQAINKVKLERRADSAWKNLEKILSSYDSVGIDSLGRVILVKRRGPK